MENMKLLCIIVSILMGLSSLEAADTLSSPMQPISKQEFLSLFRNGKPIVNRAISARILIDALRWMQEAGTRSERLPRELRIEHSLIQGYVDFSRLFETPLEKLPLDLRQLCEENYIRSVRMIPIPIYILSTKFQDKTDFSKTVFQDRVDFDDATFQDEVNFDDVIFQGYVGFDHTTFQSKGWASFNAFFQDTTSFRNTSFQGDTSFMAKFKKDVEFSDSNFLGKVFFMGAAFQDLASFSNIAFHGWVSFSLAKFKRNASFSDCIFHKDVYFNDVNFKESLSNFMIKKGRLDFICVNFEGRAYFENTKIYKLRFSPQKWSVEAEGQGVVLRIPGSPATFEKRAVFKKLQCFHANFSEAEFRDYVDFSGARFINSANFGNTTFEGEVNFFRTEFPLLSLLTSKSYKASQNNTDIWDILGEAGQNDVGLILDDVRFQKTFNLNWEQIKGKINTERTETWRVLEEAFKNSGNLKGQNEAMYQRRLLEAKESRERSGICLMWKKFANAFFCWFWGYGVRPLRLLGWVVILYLVMTSIYWTQTKPLSEYRSRRLGQWERLKFAFGFSIHTSWRFGYGYMHSRTLLFKFLTLFHAIIFKIMLVLLVISFSNISPLLREIFGKLLPV